MLLIQKIISVIAPDACMQCGDVGWLLCEACAYSEIPKVGSNCYRCGQITNDFATCNRCKKLSHLSNVWVATKYESIAKIIVTELKFNSRRGAVDIMANLCSRTLPVLEVEYITHLPTSSSHIRRRGFDQSKLIAKKLTHGEYNYAPLLRRIKKVHQIGANKKQRQEQLAGAFVAVNKYLIKNAKILLVDDVATTGASLEEAARTLKKAGAKEVSAIVFART